MLDFSLFFPDFYLILIELFLKLKLQKSGVIYRRTAGLMWQGNLTWRAEPAQMQRDTQGHVAKLREPMRSSSGATWSGRVAWAT